MLRSRPLHSQDFTAVVLLHEIDEHRHAQNERTDVVRYITSKINTTSQSSLEPSVIIQKTVGHTAADASTSSPNWAISPKRFVYTKGCHHVFRLRTYSHPRQE
jgi:hypothetical protein